MSINATNITDATVIKLLVNEGIVTRPLLSAINFQSLNSGGTIDSSYLVEEIVGSGVTGATMGSANTSAPAVKVKSTVNRYDTVMLNTSAETLVLGKKDLTSFEATEMVNSLFYIHDSLLIGGYVADEVGRVSTLPTRNMVSLSTSVSSSGTWASMDITEIKAQINSALDNATTGALTKKRKYDTIYLSEKAYRQAGALNSPTDAQGFIQWLGTNGLRIVVDPMLDSVQDETSANLGGVAFLYPYAEVKGVVSLLPTAQERQGSLNHNTIVTYAGVGGIHKLSAVSKPITMIKGIA